MLSKVSCSNLLKVGTYAFIFSMACTDVHIVDDLQLYDTNTQCMSHFTSGNSSLDKINNYIPYLPRRDKEYNFPDTPDDEADSQLQFSEPHHFQESHRDQTKLKKSTLLTSTLFDLGMGPEYSSDIAGDGPRKRTFDEDE